MEDPHGAKMPHPSHHIAIFLVPTNPEHLLSDEDATQLFSELTEQQVVDEDGWAGEAAPRWIQGGFGRLRLDRPTGPVVYGNRQGGYRAQCPSCKANLVKVLGLGLSGWRSGAGRGFSCPKCHRPTALEDLVYSPKAAPGRWALVFSRAEAAEVEEEALAWLNSQLSTDFHTIVSRG
jgi:hypothetical protein